MEDWSKYIVSLLGFVGCLIFLYKVIENILQLP